MEMICPSCKEAMVSAEPECPHCGFKLDNLRENFGAVPRYSAYVTDTTLEEITIWEMKRIRRYLEYFEKKFPQSRLSFFVTRLLPGIPLPEYAFYLFNRCHFAPMRAREEKNYAILFIVDVSSDSATLMTGYGLEGLLEPEDLEYVLDKCRPHLEASKYIKIADVAVREISKILKKKIASAEVMEPA